MNISSNEISNMQAETYSKNDSVINLIDSVNENAIEIKNRLKSINKFIEYYPSVEPDSVDDDLRSASTGLQEYLKNIIEEQEKSLKLILEIGTKLISG